MPSDFWLSVRSAMYGATSTWGMRSEPCNSYPWGMGRCTADVISISIEVLLNVASLALHDGECELLQHKRKHPHPCKIILEQMMVTQTSEQPVRKVITTLHLVCPICQPDRCRIPMGTVWSNTTSVTQVNTVVAQL